MQHPRARSVCRLTQPQSVAQTVPSTAVDPVHVVLGCCNRINRGDPSSSSCWCTCSTRRLVRVSPQAYNEVINTYKTPIVGLMEMGLVAAVPLPRPQRGAGHPDRLLAARPALSGGSCCGSSSAFGLS